jgi:hypothetical protein
VRSFFILLTMLVFGVAHAAAAPSMLCRHVTAEAHAAARASSDVRIAGEAEHEEAAAAALAADKLAASSDKTASNLGHGLLPQTAYLTKLIGPGTAPWLQAIARPLVGRAFVPLLRPPSV